jgi:hypothetical protein
VGTRGDPGEHGEVLSEGRLEENDKGERIGRTKKHSEPIDSSFAHVSSYPSSIHSDLRSDDRISESCVFPIDRLGS